MPAKLQPPALVRTGPVTVLSGRKELWYFGGCDYHGLAWEPSVLEAAAQAARDYGMGVSASRRTTGNHPLYEDLEEALAGFFQAPASIVVSSGYLTNLCAAQAMAGDFDAVYIDEKAHASLADAALHFRASKIVAFRHRSPEHLKSLVQKEKPSARGIVLTDGMFAYDGSLAPLADYKDCLPRTWWLLVDDAHAAGTLGSHGQGSLEFHRLGFRNTIQTTTLSKAFGASGGAILGSAKVIERIRSSSRALTGSTPPPLPATAAAIRSLALLQESPRLLQQLEQNAGLIRSAATQAGWSIRSPNGPITAWEPEEPSIRAKLKKTFADSRVHLPWITYPGGGQQGYLRLAISSAHPPESIEALAEAVASVICG